MLVKLIGFFKMHILKEVVLNQIFMMVTLVTKAAGNLCNQTSTISCNQSPVSDCPFNNKGQCQFDIDIGIPTFPTQTTFS